MRNLFVFVIYLSFFAIGFVAPFVISLGYVWVDLFRPQAIMYGGFNVLPISALIGVAAIGSYFLFDRDQIPPRRGTIYLMCLFALWVTMTTYWAVVPDHAWVKWDWAFKAILFGAFLPFVMRDRIRIEAYLLVLLICIAAAYLPIGVKTFLSGGGYGRDLSLLQNNTGLSESSIVSLAAVIALPLLNYFCRSNLIFTNRLVRLGIFVPMMLFVPLAVIGTGARTGLVALLVLGTLYLWEYPHKVRNVILICFFAGIAALSASAEWYDRMSTIIHHDEEGSALVRLQVWQWTIEYVASHPLGGGFDVYRINEFSYVTESGQEIYGSARAFHSMYFEVLGEHGIVGFLIFGLIIFLAYRNTIIPKPSRPADEDRAWIYDLGRTLRIVWIVYLTGAAFVGIAFQPLTMYLIAATICLANAHARVALPESADERTRERMGTAERDAPTTDGARPGLAQRGESFGSRY